MRRLLADVIYWLLWLLVLYGGVLLLVIGLYEVTK